MNIYCYISMIKMSIKNHGVRREEILCKDIPGSNGTLEWHSVWMVEPSDKSAMENECSAGGTYLVEKRLLDVYRKRTWQVQTRARACGKHMHACGTPSVLVPRGGPVRRQLSRLFLSVASRKVSPWDLAKHNHSWKCLSGASVKWSFYH